MTSTADLRATLKVMRESSADHVPVSRMRRSDISGAIERLKFLTETTPAIAQTKRGLPDSMKPEKKVKMVESASSSDEEKPMKVSKKPLVVKEVKEKAPAAKESMKERMNRIRAMKKKD